MCLRENQSDERDKMISSLFYFCWRCLMFMFNILKFFHVWANATSLQIVFAIALLIYVMCRYFRLKQPNLPGNIEDAIRGCNRNPKDINNHVLNDCQNHRDSTAMEWWPIANRAACLDSVENSRTAIEKVRNICYLNERSNGMLEENGTNRNFNERKLFR